MASVAAFAIVGYISRVAIAPIAAQLIASSTGPGFVTARENGRGAKTYGDTSAASASATTPARSSWLLGLSNVSSQRNREPIAFAVWSSSGTAMIGSPTCKPRSRWRPIVATIIATIAAPKATSRTIVSAGGVAITSGVAAITAATPATACVIRQRSPGPPTIASYARVKMTSAARTPAKYSRNSPT